MLGESVDSPSAGDQKIGKAHLGAVEVTSLSLAGVAPFFSMAFATGLAAKGAGSAVPMAYALGGLGALALGYVVIGFARRYADASGVAYTFVRNSVGETSGFVAGWIYILCWLCGTASVLTVGSVSAVALASRYGIGIDWYWVFLPLLGTTMVLNYIGVRVSLGMLVLFELGSMVFLSVVALIIIAKGGADGNSLRPFYDTSLAPNGWSGVAFGMIYAFAGFAGFEAAAALGRETQDPEQVIPRAIGFSLVGGALFYLLVTYALAIGYGLGNHAEWASDPAPLDRIITIYLGPQWATVTDILVVFAAFASALGLLTLTSRSMLDISRNGQAPAWLGRVHHRFGTPHLGILFAGGVAMATFAALGLPAGPTTLIGFISASTTLGYILVYSLMAAGGLKNAARAPDMSVTWRLGAILAPLVSLLLLGFAFYASIFPRPPYPLNLTPVALGVALALTLAWALLLRLRGRNLDFAEPDGDISHLDPPLAVAQS